MHWQDLRSTYSIGHLDTTQDNFSRQKQLQIIIIVRISLTLTHTQEYWLYVPVCN